jgi:hypothetical protein
VLTHEEEQRLLEACGDRMVTYKRKGKEVAMLDKGDKRESQKFADFSVFGYDYENSTIKELLLSGDSEFHLDRASFSTLLPVWLRVGGARAP